MKTRLNHCFQRYKTDLTLTQADISAPTAPRFAVIISNLLNIHFRKGISRQQVHERLIEVDQSIELKRAQNRVESEKLETLQNQVETMKPTFEKTSIEIEKINAEIERKQREMKQAVDQVNIEKKIMAEKSLKKETLGRQVSNVEVIIT